MIARPLTIWTNFRRPETLSERLNGHKVLISEHLPDEADIAFGQPEPRRVIESSRLRWIHLNTAGYTRYDSDEMKSALRARGAMLTNSSSVFDEPCAEHALAMMLGLARQLPQAMGNQLLAKAWPYTASRAKSQLLLGQNVLLVGFGAIARRLVELLAPFRMEIVGVRRNPLGNETVRIVNIDQLDELLPWADHVMNILPASPSTMQFFDAAKIAKMKSSAIFYNIGRGDTVDQLALIEALKQNRIAAAYLDVMTPEPLPADDPLWTTPNCFITTHTAGGHHNEHLRLIDHFMKNFARFVADEPLADRIV